MLQGRFVNVRVTLKIKIFTCTAVWYNDVFTLQQKPIRHTNHGKQRNENSGIFH